MTSVREYREKIVSGPVLKTMLWLAWPPIIASLVNVSYNFIDTLWLSRLGAAEMDAPRQVWFIFMVLFSIGMGFSAGNTAIISQYVGSGDFKKASECARQLFIVTFSLGGLFGLLVFITAPFLLNLIGTPKEVYPFSIIYMRVASLGIPLGFIGFSLNTVFHAFGDTRTPTILHVGSSIFNAILDPLFIFGLFGFPALGVVGAALATVLSRSLVAVTALTLLFKGVKGIKISLKNLSIELAWLKQTIHIGGPIMIQQLMNSLAFTTLIAIVNIFGVIAVSAYTIGMAVIQLIDASLWGFSRATSIVIGQNLGANSHERAFKAAKLSMIVVGSALALGTILLLNFKDPLINLFIKETTSKEEAIILSKIFNEARKLLDLFAISVPFFGVFFISMAVARGSGHTVAVTILSILRLWVIRIGLSYIFAILLAWGTIGIWSAMCLSNIFAGLAGALWVLKGNWLRKII